MDNNDENNDELPNEPAVPEINRALEAKLKRLNDFVRARELELSMAIQALLSAKMESVRTEVDAYVREALREVAPEEAVQPRRLRRAVDEDEAISLDLYDLIFSRMRMAMLLNLEQGPKYYFFLEHLRDSIMEEVQRDFGLDADIWGRYNVDLNSLKEKTTCVTQP